MKKLLPAFLFFISFTILLGACRRGSHAVSSILLLADSLMQSHPDSSLQLLEAIPAPQKMGKQTGHGMPCCLRRRSIRIMCRWRMIL